MEIIVRKAILDDYDAVMRIMNQVQELHVFWRPDLYRPNRQLFSKESFGSACSDDLFFVAEFNSKVAGVMGLAYRHIESLSQVTRDVVFIDSMAVDEPYRNRGVGHAFFDFVKELALQKKADGIELQVNARNRQAYDMYRRYGFTEKSINMELLHW